MLRVTVRTSLRPRRAPQHVQRSFVSSVLLSKTYEDKTVAELRSELRTRGLSVSGTKGTLITRIHQSDVRSASEAPPTPRPTPSQSQARSVSSSSSKNAEVALAAVPRSSAPPITFDVKLPDVSQPSPESTIQVPFVPDFWDSFAKKREGAGATPSGLSTPKIMLAAGAETYPAGGPTYAMSPAPDTLPSSDPAPPPKKYDGLLGDVLDDLGVPHSVLSASPSSTEMPQELSAKRITARPLDEEERRGAMALLGLFLGAWVIAGIAAPSQGKREKKSTEKAH